jgi:hypothetical protein
MLLYSSPNLETPYFIIPEASFGSNISMFSFPTKWKTGLHEPLTEIEAWEGVRLSRKLK